MLNFAARFDYLSLRLFNSFQFFFFLAFTDIMGKCKATAAWLSRDDGTGHVLREWATIRGQNLQCTLCLQEINVGKKGFQAVTSHVKSIKHKDEVRVKLPTSQLRLVPLAPPTPKLAQSAAAKPVALYNPCTASRHAELKWILFCIKHNHSAKSTDGIGELFRSIFQCEASKNFKLSRTKFRYILNEALGPHCHELLLKDMKNRLFTLIFDETTNVSSKKQLSIMVRYFSESLGKIVIHHLQTYFMGSATGQLIFEKLCYAMESNGLSYKNLLMLSSDGPNVNKTVYCLLNEKKKNMTDGRSLVSFGTCNLHIAHNTFAKGLSVFGEDAAELASSLHRFFDGWPARKEDYESIQQKTGVKSHNFLKHVPSRWVTLLGACERIVEQFPAIMEYFLKFVPLKREKTVKSPLFKKIANYLRKDTCKAEVLFVISSANIFQPFLKRFQSEGPLMHVLYSSLNELVLSLVRRVSKSEGLPDCYEEIDETFFEEPNLLSSVDCGELVSSE
jgi:hypothetical protein